MAIPWRPVLVGWLALAVAGASALAGPPAGPFVDVVQTIPDAVVPGQPIPVEITVRNASSAAAEGLQVIDNLPAGCDTQEVLPEVERTGDRLIWSVPRLAAGEERRFRLKLVRRPEATAPEIHNSVDVIYACRQGCVGVTRVAGAQLGLDVQAVPSAFVGEALTLWITARNSGTLAARNLALQTILPAGLSHPRGSDLELPLESLAPGTQRKLTLAVTPTRAGEFHVRLSLVGEGSQPIVHDVAVVVQDIRLTVAVKGPENLPQQLTGLFELAVRNDGAACPVSVAVLLPEGLAFGRASDRGTYDPSTHSIRWDLGGVPAGGERRLAWNGMPRKPGEMACKVRVLSGDRVWQEASWAVRVIPGDAP
jgi:uncharacterized repeat protein (TIGR01451 family)